MDLTVPATALSELAAAYLQAAVTAALAVLCAALFVRYKKRHFVYWSIAWLLYALRLAAIISFIHTSDRLWLYWHQVTTGWTALALLWAALVFSQQLEWRSRYLWAAVFPPLWSYVAIYRLDSFMLAAGPAVLFLSAVTVWTGVVFYQYHRQIGSLTAAFLSLALFLWGLHHLDYPFLRARGIWNPWGYYLDILFVLSMGAGILALVLEDLHRGIRILSALSGDLHGIVEGETDVVERLLQRPLSLAGVRGTALYLSDQENGRFVAGAGLCSHWPTTQPSGAAESAILSAIEQCRPLVAHATSAEAENGAQSFGYAAAIPIVQVKRIRGAMVFVGDARDPFAALDTAFLSALGHQVGAALENAGLYGRLSERKAELERLATKMLAQHEEERNRLSRELHDETAQVFSAVKLELGVLRENVSYGSDERLDRILTLVDEGIRGIRNVARQLRPALLDDLGLIPALRTLTAEFESQSGITTHLDVPMKSLPLSKAAEHALFRALQEGLSNVARHAEATSVRVSLATNDHAATLVLCDNGKGAPSRNWDVLASKGQMGLTGMRERISELGGTVGFDPEVTEGLCLKINLPLHQDSICRTNS